MEPNTDTSGQGHEASTSGNEEGVKNERTWKYRRGHSDGDVLSYGLGLSRRRSTEGSRENAETWIDFLRQAPSGGADVQERAKASVRRAAMVAADRKRHIQDSQDDFSRRRSTSTMSVDQSARIRRRHQILPATRSSGSASTSQHSTQNATPVDVNRPLPQVPSAAVPRARLIGEIVLPRWQPDTEVSECPICGKTFGFWFRKHHCRKCGRVVCSNCSPHRITIPRQFIVHPPEDLTCGMVGAGSAQVEVVDLTADDDEFSNTIPIPAQQEGSPQGREYRLDSALGGGQEVRLCNPCVPDPNPLPPPSYPSPSPQALTSFPRLENTPTIPRRPQSLSSRHSGSSHTSHTLERSYDASVSAQHREGHRRQTIHTLTTRDAAEPVSTRRVPTLPSHTSNSNHYTETHPGPSTNRRHSQQSRGFPAQTSSTYGSAPGTSLQDHYPRPNHRPHASAGTLPSHSNYRSMLDISSPLPPRPPQLREEDECPICHTALPPKGADGSETAREAHVASCIETHFSSSAPRNMHVPPQAAVQATVAATGHVRPTQEEVHDRDSGGIGTGTPQRRRATGMVIYHASEKDCIGEDGEEPQECVICFEEFSVGDEMGRLECLCKFHKTCIRQWWDTKGLGACPVHQEGGL